MEIDMMKEPDVMVYLMTGFLDSGKTQFLNFTLSQDYFQIDGKTLLILCEEGEEEYDPMEMLKYGVVIETVEEKEDLTEEWLEEMNKKHEPERAAREEKIKSLTQQMKVLRHEVYICSDIETDAAEVQEKLRQAELAAQEERNEVKQDEQRRRSSRSDGAGSLTGYRGGH